MERLRASSKNLHEFSWPAERCHYRGLRVHNLYSFTLHTLLRKEVCQLYIFTFCEFATCMFSPPIRLKEFKKIPG